MKYAYFCERLLTYNMTEKQEKILHTALELFAKQGYANTSTSHIARDAGVSEGLIFRHFTSKEGLLDAIVSMGLADMEQVIGKIKANTQPLKVIEAALLLPESLIRKDPQFWKVQFSLKYQSPDVAKKYHQSEMMAEAHRTLSAAFGSLGYKQPELEAQFLLMVITSFFMLLLQDELPNYKELMQFVKGKYKI